MGRGDGDGHSGVLAQQELRRRLREQMAGRVRGQPGPHQSGGEDRREAGRVGHSQASSGHLSQGPCGRSAGGAGHHGDCAEIFFTKHGRGRSLPKPHHALRLGGPIRHEGADYAHCLAVDGEMGGLCEEPVRAQKQQPHGIPGRLRHGLHRRDPPLRRDGHVPDPITKTGAVQGRKRQLKGDSLWRQGIFLFGTEDGVYSGRSVRRMAPAARTNKELFDKFVGLPAKEAREGEGPSSKKRTVEEDVQHLLARRAAEDAKIARTSGSSGSRAEEAEPGEMDTQTERKRAPIEPETGTKRIKIGGVVAATLYKPQEELDHFEEFDEAWVEAEGDAEEGDKEILDFSDRIPEVMAGKRAELAKMDKYDTYEPRPSAEAAGKKILDSTWVIRAKPDGTIKCRFCLRDLKSKSSERTDVFAVASSQATFRRPQKV